MPGTGQFATDFGSETGWRRASRWLGRTAACGVVACLALSFWIGGVSDVDDHPSDNGRAGGVVILVWRIPALAVGHDPGDLLAVGLARAYLAFAIMSIVAGGCAGVAWLRADRIRKPLRREGDARHIVR